MCFSTGRFEHVFPALCLSCADTAAPGSADSAAGSGGGSAAAGTKAADTKAPAAGSGGSVGSGGGGGGTPSAHILERDPPPLARLVAAAKAIDWRAPIRDHGMALYVERVNALRDVNRRRLHAAGEGEGAAAPMVPAAPDGIHLKL